MGDAPPSELLGIGLLVSGTFFFALVSCAIKFAGMELPVLVMCQVRGVLETLMGLTVMRALGVEPVWSVWLVVRSAAHFAFILCWWNTLLLLPVGDATTMIYTAPVFAAAFGWVLLGETVDASFVAVLTLNFLGVVCVAQPSFLFGGPDAEPGHSHGLCLALAAAVCAGFLPICTRKMGGVSWVVVNGASSVLTAGVFAPAGLLLDPPRKPFDLRARAGWLLAACTLGYLAVALQTQGYQRARAARGSVVGATEIPFSYALQWFLFGKEPTQFGLAGSLLIMTASAGNAYVQFSREANLKRLREAELSPRGLEMNLCAE